jgi:pimeloyl-ACP methyl ester carboxylesterase
MFYQYMVNHPHAFYLRFFLNKNINVMIWNYRGYGLSHGSPDPYLIRRDSEVLLNYMKTKMNLKGKVGVYGRSLGGVVTAHLAD